MKLVFFFASVLVGIMLCLLFKDRISGFSNLDTAGEHDINIDTPPAETLGLKGDATIGIVAEEA